jgi:hypothetical protein
MRGRGAKFTCRGPPPASTLQLEHRDPLCAGSGCHCADQNGEHCFLDADVVPFSCDSPIPEMQQALRERN